MGQRGVAVAALIGLVMAVLRPVAAAPQQMSDIREHTHNINLLPEETLRIDVWGGCGLGLKRTYLSRLNYAAKNLR